MNALLRVLKRKTSFEATAIEFYEVELHTEGQPDLDLSVFDVEDGDSGVLRMHAEFAASFRTPPPGTRNAVALAGCSGFVVVRTTGETEFEFTRKQHRELHFLRVEELKRVAETVVASISARCRGATNQTIREYGRGRLLDRDDEWCSLCDRKPEWGEWLAKSSAPEPSKAHQPKKANGALPTRTEGRDN